MAAYRAACLAELVEQVGRAIDSFRAGELDAFAADRVLFQYSRSAKELWKFCNLADVEMTALGLIIGPLTALALPGAGVSHNQPWRMRPGAGCRGGLPPQSDAGVASRSGPDTGKGGHEPSRL